jgi:hypothetical protein
MKLKKQELSLNKKECQFSLFHLDKQEKTPMLGSFALQDVKYK